MNSSGIFFCKECGITFPSAALLNNHKQRFCNASRVDLQARLMLERGEAPVYNNNPGGIRDRSLFPGNGAAFSAPSAQDLYHNPSALRAAGSVYNSGASTPGPRYGAVNGIDAFGVPPRSNSVEPPVSFNHGPNNYRPSPGGALAGAGLPPYIPPSYRGGDGGANAGYSAPPVSNDVFRLLEEQQRQIIAMQQQLASALNGGVERGANGGQYLSHQGGGMRNLSMEPAPPHAAQHSVIEGRYGVRAYAAEGLLAFHTIVDQTPIQLVIKQYYCRRRVGQYMPELEQRDEWGFAQAREVSGKRREGYLNFGRAEYIFNVVSANEIVIVIELVSRGRLVAWTEVLLDSLGEKVRRLRHPPVDIGGALRDFTMRSTTATIGLEVFRARWDNMGFDGEEEEPEPEPEPEPDPEPEPPPPPPPAAPAPAPSPDVPNPCTFYLDMCQGVPLSMGCCRAVVHYCDSVERLGDVVLTAYQTENSCCFEPQFDAKYDVAISDETALVIIIEAYDNSRAIVLGHAVIPVTIGAPIGNFQARLRRLAPPTTDLVLDEDDPLNFPPGLVINYRLHSTDKSARYRPLHALVDAERQMMSERSKVPKRSPAMASLNRSKMERLFAGKPGDRPDDSFVIPYNQARGLFVNLSHMRGLPKERAIYKVAMRFGGRTFITRDHDFKSDLGVPRFKGAKFVCPNLKYEAYGMIIFDLYKLSVASDGAPPTVEQVAHSFAPGWVPWGQFGRNGRYTLMWFSGPPNPSVMAKLAATSFKETVQEALFAGTLRMLKPLSTMTLSMGDPLRFDELTKEYETAAKPKFIVTASKQDFKMPSEEQDDGRLGVKLSHAAGGENLAAFNERMNVALQKAFPSLVNAL